MRVQIAAAVDDALTHSSQSHQAHVGYTLKSNSHSYIMLNHNKYHVLRSGVSGNKRKQTKRYRTLTTPAMFEKAKLQISFLAIVEAFSTSHLQNFHCYSG